MTERPTYCVIDCRVSDPSQLKGDSLDDQEKLGRQFAERSGWIVAEVFKKPHSGTTKERQDFEEVKMYIRSRIHTDKPIKKYIIKCIDRATRAGYVVYERMKRELAELGVQMCDVYGIIQPERNTLEHLGVKYKWSEYYPSESAEMITAYNGEQEVRQILTRMIGAQIRYAREGWATRRAPDGMINKRFFYDGKDRVIRATDPERSHYWVKIFEMRAAGVDDNEIVKTINAMGYRTLTTRRWDRSNKEHPTVVGKKGGKLLTVKQLQRRITQTEYAGIVCESWTKHQPVRLREFNGLVSVDLFNRANRGKVFVKEHGDGSVEVLYNYSPWGKTKRLRNNPDYPWKVITCPFCTSELLGSAPRGKSGKHFPAYHCGGVKNGKRAHSGFRVRKADLEKCVKNYIDNLRFEKGFLEKLEEKLVRKYRSKEKDIVEMSSAISRSVSELKAEQAQKLKAFEVAESIITRKMLEREIEALDVQIKDAESKRGTIEVNEKGIKGFIRYAKRVMEHPAEILEKADDLQSRRALMSLFFEKTPTYHEILNGTPKLQPIFRLSEQFKVDKSLSLTSRGIEPRLTP